MAAIRKAESDGSRYQAVRGERFASSRNSDPVQYVPAQIKLALRSSSCVGVGFLCSTILLSAQSRACELSLPLGRGRINSQPMSTTASSRSQTLATAPAQSPAAGMGLWAPPDGGGKLNSASPPGAFGESIKRSKHFRCAPGAISRLVCEFDDDPCLDQWVQIAVDVAHRDVQFTGQ